MTLSDMIAMVTDIRGAQYGEDMMTMWVNEIEAQVVEKVLNRAEGTEIEFKPYRYGEDAEKELLAPDIHQGVYLYYLFGKIDILNQEAELYNMDAAMFNDAWEEFSGWHLRNNRPKPAVGFRGF